MKRWFCAILSLGCVLSAQDAASWSVHMPATGLLPSYTHVNYISRMGERHGGSHLGLQEYTLNIPLADPYRSRVGRWSLNMQANASLTLMDVGGHLNLRQDELFDFSLPISIISAIGSKDGFVFTVAPHMAGDLIHTGRSWEIAAIAEYSERLSETFSYSIGIAFSPRFADYTVVPFVSFTWQATPLWQVRMKGYKLAALYKVTDKLQIGPCVSAEGGSWIIDTPEGQRQLRVRSLAAAVLMEYDFSKAGERKRIVSASLGSTLATSAEICRRTADHDSVAIYHYKPGLVFSAGLDFRF